MKYNEFNFLKLNKMKSLKILVITQTVIICILLLYIFKDRFSYFKEKQIRIEYEKISTKTVLEMSEEEWDIRNKFKLIEAKHNKSKPDTISYKDAKANAEFERLVKELNNPCTEAKFIDAFHRYMDFNMPDEKYDKSSIKVQNFGNCMIHVSVTTREPKYGWKTFWVFEITTNEIEKTYVFKAVIRDFKG